MNPEKSKLKALVIQDIGAKMDDQLEAAKREVHRYEGAANHLGRCAMAITSQSKRVDDDLDSGKVGQEIADYAKERLGACLLGVDDLLKHASAGKLGQEGIVAGIERCVALAKKTYDAEVLKLEAAAMQAARALDGTQTTNGPLNGPRTNSAADDLRERKRVARAAKEKSANGGDSKPRTRTRTRTRTRRKREDVENGEPVRGTMPE